MKKLTTLFLFLLTMLFVSQPVKADDEEDEFKTAIENVKITDITKSSFLVTWDCDKDIEFRVDVTDDTQGFSFYYVTTEKSYLVTSLSPGRDYSVEITGVNVNTYSHNSPSCTTLGKFKETKLTYNVVQQIDATPSTITFKWVGISCESYCIGVRGANAADGNCVGYITDTQFTVNMNMLSACGYFYVIPVRNGVVCASEVVVTKALYTEGPEDYYEKITWEDVGGKLKLHVREWGNHTNYEVKVYNRKGKLLKTKKGKVKSDIDLGKFTGNALYVKIRGIIKSPSGKKFYSAWTEKKLVLRTVKVKSKVTYKGNSMQIKLSWKKVPCVTGYKVYVKWGNPYNTFPVSYKPTTVKTVKNKCIFTIKSKKKLKEDSCCVFTVAPYTKDAKASVCGRYIIYYGQKKVNEILSVR